MFSLLGLIYLGMINTNMVFHALALLPAAILGNVIGKRFYGLLPQIPHRWLNAPLLMLLASIIFMT